MPKVAQCLTNFTLNTPLEAETASISIEVIFIFTKKYNQKYIAIQDHSFNY